MKIFQSRVINAPVQVVWDFLKPFDSPVRWNPGVVDIKIENGQDHEIGIIRHLKIHDNTVFSESLLEYSDDERFYRYKIISSPLDIENYIAMQRCIEITKENKTLAVWQSEFTCDKSLEKEMRNYFNCKVYAEGLEGLANAIERQISLET